MANGRIDSQAASVDEFDGFDVRGRIRDCDRSRFDAFQGTEEIVARSALRQINIGGKRLEIDAVDQVIDRPVAAAIEDVGDRWIDFQKIIQVFDL